MPRIPVYTQQVQQGRLPQARSNIRFSPQDASGGLDKAAAAIGEVAFAEAQRTREEQRSARLMDAYAELGTARLEIEDVVEKQYQGKAALENDLATQTGEMLKRRADQIAEGLADDDMRLRFRQTFLRESEGLKGSMMGFVQKQGEAVAEGAFKAAVETAVSKAAHSLGAGPAAIAAREELLAAVEQRGVVKGWDKPVLEGQRRAALTLFHKAVVERLQASDRAAEADAYLTPDREKEMDGTVLGDLRKTLAPASLAARAEAEVVRVEAAHPGDPAARTAAVLAIPGELGAKARQVLREREAMAEEARNDAQRTVFGSVLDAIESGAVKSESQLEKHPSFGKLVDENPARARAYLRQMQQAERTVAAAERQASAQVDESARKEFEAMSLQERAEADVRALFAGRVTGDGLNVIRKLQQTAKRDWDKDRGVSETEFRQMIAVESQGLPWISTKEDLAQLTAYLGRERGKWLDDPKNAGKEPPREEVAKWIAGSLTAIDLPLRPDQPRFRTTAPGRGPARDQPYLSRRGAAAPAASPVPAPAAVAPGAQMAPSHGAAPAVPPPAVGTRVPGEQLGYPAGTEFEVLGPNRYRRVK